MPGKREKVRVILNSAVEPGEYAQSFCRQRVANGTLCADGGILFAQPVLNESMAHLHPDQLPNP